jgi:hypothetical protein
MKDPENPSIWGKVSVGTEPRGLKPGLTSCEACSRSLFILGPSISIRIPLVLSISPEDEPQCLKSIYSFITCYSALLGTTLFKDTQRPTSLLQFSDQANIGVDDKIFQLLPRGHYHFDET